MALSNAAALAGFVAAALILLTLSARSEGRFRAVLLLGVAVSLADPIISLVNAIGADDTTAWLSRAPMLAAVAVVAVAVSATARRLDRFGPRRLQALGAHAAIGVGLTFTIIAAALLKPVLLETPTPQTAAAQPDLTLTLSLAGLAVVLALGLGRFSAGLAVLLDRIAAPLKRGAEQSVAASVAAHVMLTLLVAGAFLWMLSIDGDVLRRRVPLGLVEAGMLWMLAAPAIALLAETMAGLAGRIGHAILRRVFSLLFAVIAVALAGAAWIGAASAVGEIEFAFSFDRLRLLLMLWRHDPFHYPDIALAIPLMATTPLIVALTPTRWPTLPRLRRSPIRSVEA